MSSLRLALKISLEESEGITNHRPKAVRRKKKSHATSVTTPTTTAASTTASAGGGWGDAGGGGGDNDNALRRYRKQRGRPRKGHPTSRDGSSSPPNNDHSYAASGDEADEFSSENEFSHTGADDDNNSNNNHNDDDDDDSEEEEDEGVVGSNSTSKKIDHHRSSNNKNDSNSYDDDTRETSKLPTPNEEIGHHHRPRQPQHLVTQHSAAHKIQSHWKKKLKTTEQSHSDQGGDDDDNVDDNKKDHHHPSSSKSMGTALSSNNKETLDSTSTGLVHAENNKEPSRMLKSQQQDDSRRHTEPTIKTPNATITTGSDDADSMGETDRGDIGSSSRGTMATAGGGGGRSSTNELNSSNTISKSKTVPPPTSDIIDWMRHLPFKEARKNVVPGLRVKVRFATKVKRDGKILKKKKWFGGRVSAVSKEGSKIRIKYDDGTTEVSKFPDSDIVICDAFNGTHGASAEKFIPPSSESQSEDETKKKSPTTKIEAILEKSKTEVTTISEPIHPMVENKRDDASLLVHDPLPMNAPSGSSNKTTVEKSESAEQQFLIATNTATNSHMDKSQKGSVVPTVDVANTEALSTTDTWNAKKRSRYMKTKLLNPDDESIVPSTKTTTTTTTNVVEMVQPQVLAESTNNSTDLLDRQLIHQSGTNMSTPGDVPLSTVSIPVVDSGVNNCTLPVTTTNESDGEEGSHRDISNRLTIRIPGQVKMEAEDEVAPILNKSMKQMDIIKDSSTSGQMEIPVSSPISSSLIEPIVLSRKRPHHDTRGTDDTDEPQTKRLHIHIPIQKAALAPDGVSNLKVEGGVTEPIQKSPLSVRTKKSRKKLENIEDVKELKQHHDRRQRDPTLPLREDVQFDADNRLASTSTDRSEQESAKLQATNEHDHDSTTGPKSSSAAPGVDSKSTHSPQVRSSKNMESSAVRSGRRAAKQANERIAAKQELDDKTSKKKRRKRKEIEGGEESESSEDDSQWVQCDACSKWRVIPSRVVSSLPKQWYCSDNIYDPKRATCDAPEQTPKQAAKGKKRMKKRQQRLAMESTVGVEVEEPVVHRQDPPKERAERSLHVSKEEVDAVVKPKRTPSIDHLAELHSGMSSQPQQKSEKKAKRVRTQETADVSQADVSALETKRGRGRPRRNPVPNRENKVFQSSSVVASDEAENLEWVQCEKCNKWRKLPPHISADELPEVWYCSMNTWNPTSSSCDTPEDKAEGLQDVGVFGSSGALTSGKLSYRNLIFGNTGRKANRPVSERARALESLFGVASEDDDSPPVVMYAQSSAFVARSRNVPIIEENEHISFLDLMSRSNLWEELRGAALPLGFKLRPSAYTFHTLPSDVQEAMKALILHILSSRLLVGEEIVEEAQRLDVRELPKSLHDAQHYCSLNVVVTTLCELVKEGKVECVQKKGSDWTIKDWNPRFRCCVRPSVPQLTDGWEQAGNRSESRCMKISKPWKRQSAQELC